MTKDERTTHGLVAVGLPMAKITRPLFGRRGFVHGALITDWPAIVGSAMAIHTMPLGIRFPKGERVNGVLEIKVAASAFSTQLQHLEPLVIERVNGYFGWRAVERLKLRHGPLPKLDRPKGVKPVTDLPAPSLAVLDRVEDPELRAVLQRLGAHLVSKPNPS